MHTNNRQLFHQRFARSVGADRISFIHMIVTKGYTSCKYCPIFECNCKYCLNLGSLYQVEFIVEYQSKMVISHIYYLFCHRF